MKRPLQCALVALVLASTLHAQDIGAQNAGAQDIGALAAEANAALSSGDLPAAVGPLSALAEMQPGNSSIRFQLGRALMAAERFEDAAAAFEGVAGPVRPTALYNAACSFARAGHAAEAVARLESSVDAGFADVDLMRTDSDLASLRETETFRSLVGTLEEELGAPFVLDPDAPRTWFDWWIGEWTPTTGLPASFAQTTEWGLNGTAICARTEVSQTLLNWQPQLGVWRMNWSSAFGDHDRLEGGLEGDKLVMHQDEIRLQPGQIGRLTYANIRENAFQMLWETSADEGQSWSMVTQALFRRTAPKAAPTPEVADARLAPYAFRVGSWHTQVKQRVPGNTIQGRGSLEVAASDDGSGLVEQQWIQLDNYTSWSVDCTRTCTGEGRFDLALEASTGLSMTGHAQLVDDTLVETVQGTSPAGPWTDTHRYEQIDADHWRLTVSRVYENGPSIDEWTVLEAWRKRG
ncbi:MAG: tetratricopeptide repeat protein [Planctomycetota bacterium]